MKRNLETAFVTQCAPVLAGLKPANLFRWVEQDDAKMRLQVLRLQAAVAAKNITVCVIKRCPAAHAYLVYAYRASRLAAVLANAQVHRYLAGEGYTPAAQPEGYLQQLSQRLCCGDSFPHEIGVFLGYPLEDVIGFVQNRGKNYVCCGYWKAYGDPARAQAEFARYRKCIEVYLRCYGEGVPITKLAVAV